jgi:hypothetical protein
MTAEASDGGVRTEQWKTGAVVQHDLTFGNPVAFVVTLDTSRTKLPTMLVFVTADTTSLGKHGHRTTVVVAAQALRVLVRTDQGDPGFEGVVKTKVGSDLIPTAAFVAQRAVFRKRVVGNYWAATLVPLMRSGLFVSRRHDARGRQVASGKRQP